MGLRTELERELVKRALCEPKTAIEILIREFGIDLTTFKYELMELYRGGKVFGVIIGDYLVYLSKDDPTIPTLDVVVGTDPEKLKEEYLQSKETKFAENGTAGTSESFKFISSFASERNKENNLNLQVRTGFKGAKITLFIMIENLNEWDLEKLNLKIEIPEILRLFRINEDLNYVEANSQLVVSIPSVQKNSIYHITILFKPIEIGNAEFKGTLQFYNHIKKVRFLPIEPIGLKLVPPKLTPLSECIELNIKEYVKGEKKKKNILSFGVPFGSDPGVIFKYLRDSLIANNLIELGCVENDGRMISTHYGIFEQDGKKGDIAVIGQVYNDKFEIYGCSDYGFVIATLLTKIMLDLRKRFLAVGILKNGDKLSELNCTKCDVPLPQRPQKGETVSCQKCKTDQIPVE